MGKPMIENGAATAASFEAVFCFALLHVLAETRAQAGLDGDPSVTIDRTLAAVGHFDQVARAASAEGAPYDPMAKAARAKVREALKRFGPVLTRIALAARSMG